MKKFTRWSRRIERNILAVYARANESDRAEGLFWYSKAHDTARNLAEKHGISVAQAVGVIAAISPGNSWGRNILEADEFIHAYVHGYKLPSVGVYGRRNVAKARRILNGESGESVLHTKTGPKVWAFYSNILNPHISQELTIDRHAKGLAYNFGSQRKGFATDDKLSIVGRVEYRYLVRHYRVIAERLGLVPHQLQAITWVTWKRIEGRMEQSEIPF
ncbi:MAG TPA: hypothetical protein VIY48_05965 [Candidatus Paceibacterota bacterium]